MGIDLSLTGTAYAFHDGETYDWRLIETKPKEHIDRWHRYEFIANEVCTAIESRNPSFVILEDYICSPYNVKTTMALIEMGAIVRHKINGTKINDHNVPWMTVVGSQLKKYITGRGIGHKSLIMKEVYKNLDVDVNDDNVADAIVLSKIAADMHVYRHDNVLPQLKYRAEVLKKIESNRETFNESYWVR
jgi:Holliday junction resolvasome RuvABC endonuclease subunit